MALASGIRAEVRRGFRLEAHKRTAVPGYRGPMKTCNERFCAALRPSRTLELSPTSVVCAVCAGASDP